MPGTAIVKATAQPVGAWDPSGQVICASSLPPAGQAKLTMGQYARMFLSGQDVGSGASLGGPTNAYKQSVWVHRCISAIATNGARVPARISRGPAAGTRGIWAAKRVRAGVHRRRRICTVKGADAQQRAVEGEIVESGPLADVLERPNPEQSWHQFIVALITQQYRWGRVHVLYDEMVGRKPKTMYVVPGHKSRPIVDASGRVPRLMGWMLRDPRHNEYPVTLDEVITWQLYDPDDPHGALSPLEPARLSIVSDYNASLTNAAMLGNDAEPGGVLTADGPFNQEIDDETRAKWLQRFRGPMNARKLGILWGGLKYQPISRSLVEMVWPAGKQMSREEICAVLGTPASVAGFFGTTGDSSAFTSNELKRFWQDTETPLLDVIYDGFQIHLVGRFDATLEIWADIEDVPIFQELRAAQTQTAQTYWSMGVPLADIDSWLDLGLPERPWHETGWLPMGVQPASMAAEPFALPPLPEGEPEEPEPEPEPEAEEPIEESAELTSVEKASATQVWRRWEDSWAPLAKASARTLAANYYAQSRAIVRLLRAEMPARPAGGPAARAAGAATKDAATVQRILAEIFDDPEERRRFLIRLHRHTRDGWELGIRQALAEAGIPAERASEMLAALLGNPRLSAAMTLESLRITTRVNAYTRAHIRRSLIQGMAEGEDIRHLADRVQSFMGGRRAASLTVARNTVGQALSASRAEGRRAGGITHEIWLHSRGPGHRRPAHVAAERRYAANPKPIGERWQIGSARLRYPRDPLGPASEIVNCQCVAIGKRLAPGETVGTLAILAEHLSRGCITYPQMLAARRIERAATEEHEHGTN